MRDKWKLCSNTKHWTPPSQEAATIEERSLFQNMALLHSIISSSRAMTRETALARARVLHSRTFFPGAAEQTNRVYTETLGTHIKAPSYRAFREHSECVLTDKIYSVFTI